jgi:DNA invertase Pin-like site-specific DNA recombinase
VARANGQHLGRRAGIHTRIKVTPVQERLVKRLKAEGQGITHIAKSVRLSRPTIYHILASRK